MTTVQKIKSYLKLHKHRLLKIYLASKFQMLRPNANKRINSAINLAMPDGADIKCGFSEKVLLAYF